MSPIDRRAFVAEIAAKYSGRLRRFLKLNLSNAADVPDLAQEIFLRLMRVRDHDQIRSPESYLFTVASHVVQQHAQKSASAPESLEVAELFSNLEFISQDNPSAEVETQQHLQELEKVLNQLPPRVALALLMHRYTGHSIEEIASQLGVAQITVKKYLAKALLHCRDTFEGSE